MAGPPPAPRCRAFGLAKAGHGPEEYEDAHAAAPERGRLAVADGATESSFAGAWARLLVEGFVERPAPRPADWQGWLPPLQARWLAQEGGRPLPWYAAEKARQGAFAAFLGLVLEEARGATRWRAVAVGDCCLFHVRGDRLLRAFPLRRADDFTNTPWLVGTPTPAGALVRKGAFRTCRGRCRPGDRLWLATDALSQWFLREVEAGQRPWEALGELLEAPDDAFAAWVGERRSDGALHNDDVTLLAVCF
jgi:hypothetical protein